MNFGRDTADPSAPTLQAEVRRILNDESTAANLSYAFAATSAILDEFPLCSWPISAWVNRRIMVVGP